MLDVKEVVLQLDFVLFHRRPVAVLDLRPTGDSRAQRMALAVIGNLFFQHVGELRLFWPRSNKTHIPAQNIHELRKFVDAENADKPSYPCNAGVSVGGPRRSRSQGFGPHRAELENLKVPSLATDSSLPKEHGSAALDKHREGYQEHYRQGQNDTHGRDDNIDRPLCSKDKAWLPKSVGQNQPTGGEMINQNAAR